MPGARLLEQTRSFGAEGGEKRRGRVVERRGARSESAGSLNWPTITRRSSGEERRNEEGGRRYYVF